VAWDIRRQSGGKVNLRVVGVDGRRVKSWSEKTIPAGPTRILWDGRDDQGQRVASGRYFLVVTDETGHMRTNAATVVR
jgi:flagellar hook assembly protein FlgD